MPLPKDKAWFPAKTYGWGWGMPTRWQGFVVLFCFPLALTLGALLILPRSLFAFLGWVAVVSAALTGICYWKGEAPRWRWGDDDREHKP